MRYFIYIAYLGSKAYNGWQIQKNGFGVQQVVEEALSKLLSKKISISGSSRTDKGVHAVQQVAHFDLVTPINLTDLVYRLNRILPSDVSISNIRPVVSGAHARFDALYRKYAYMILTEKNPFYIDNAVWLGRMPPLGLLNQIAALFCVKTDFEFFSKKTDSLNSPLLKPLCAEQSLGADRLSTLKYSSLFEAHRQPSLSKPLLQIESPKRYSSFICHIEEAIWVQKDQKFIFQIKANRFLRGMVRAIVGMILKVATGKMDLQELAGLIKKKTTMRPILNLMPPHGLTLIEVGYPTTLFI